MTGPISETDGNMLSQEIQRLNNLKMNGDANSWPWYTNFIGQTMQHNYWVYHRLGEVLIENPQIRGILEIGTGCGAMTIFLGCWGCRLGIPVETWDIDLSRMEPIRPVLTALGVRINHGDCFSDEAQRRIRGFLQDQAPAYLFCDGGDKPREINHFGPWLTPHSLLSGHDWGQEIYEKDITACLTQHGFERWKPEQWMDRNIQVMTLKKTASEC